MRRRGRRAGRLLLHQDRDRPDFARSILPPGLVAVEPVAGQDRPLGHRLRHRRKAHPAPGGGHDRERLPPALGGRPNRDTRRLPQCLGVDPILLAEADQQDSLGADPAPGVENQRLAPLAPEVSGGQEREDRVPAAIHRRHARGSFQWRAS
jgi:hypothetical protein